MPYHAAISDLNGPDAETVIEKLADRIAFGFSTRIWDDRGPGEPVRIFVHELPDRLQDRVCERIDSINAARDEVERRDEALDREYGPVWYPPIEWDGPPPWLIRKPAPAG